MQEYFPGPVQPVCRWFASGVKVLSHPHRRRVWLVASPFPGELVDGVECGEDPLSITASAVTQPAWSITVLFTDYKAVLILKSGGGGGARR